MSCIQCKPQIPSRELTLVDGVSQLPEKMMYKPSYQTEGHPSEGTLLSRFYGQFGIVDVIGHHVCTVEELFGSTVHHLLNAQSWKVADGCPVSPPEIKQLPLHCVGARGIPTPAELLETILHSTIGHYNLFLRGVLHRDVSIGNILCLQNQSTRSLAPPLDLPDQDVKLCRGFLIDGDHAIEWCKDAITPSSERLGTLPFISIRLLGEWYLDRPVLHMAVDDLESFLWVLVWSLVHILQRYKNKNSIIHRLGNILPSRNYTDMFLKERLTKQEWTDKAFGGLIQDWQRISEASQGYVSELQKVLIRLVNDGGSDTGDAQEGIFDELNEHSRKVYRQLHTLNLIDRSGFSYAVLYE
ncbi:hypothetical protein EDB87DRAFT_1682669 [Lactarius vividus]|nr:hypothetical protein EDB87DRAFT_1682669 [Lactarius vividus]